MVYKESPEQPGLHIEKPCLEKPTNQSIIKSKTKCTCVYIYVGLYM